jgi:regulator of protease activity HflC (stomatin/prohibitin superfamily)
MTQYDDSTHFIGKLIGYGIAFVVLLILFFSTIYIIDAGYSGVLTTFGKVEQNAIQPGLHFKIPIIQGIVAIEVRTQKYEAEASASSSDLQVVTAKIATNYHLIAQETPQLYNDIGLSYSDRVIQPMEQEVVKSVTAKYSAEQLITERELVRQEIKTLMTERLQPRGIIVEEVSIVNFDFSPSFNEAIEAKVTQEQNALAAKNKLDQVKYEAQQAVEKANGDAQAIQIEGNALRLNPAVLQLRAIEKWDGHMPQVTSGAMPFIDITPQQQGGTQ